jgi:hypothetical protein
LGKCYLYGYGTDQDLKLALEKLHSAEEDFFELIEEGDPFAAITLKKVCKELDEVRKKLYDLHGIE